MLPVKRPEEIVIKQNEHYAAEKTSNSISVIAKLIDYLFDEYNGILATFRALLRVKKLNFIPSSIDDDVQMDILQVSVSVVESLASTMYAIKTMEARKAAYDHVLERQIEYTR